MTSTDSNCHTQLCCSSVLPSISTHVAPQPKARVGNVRSCPATFPKGPDPSSLHQLGQTQHRLPSMGTEGEAVPTELANAAAG